METMKAKLVVNHLSDGSFGDNLCLICLLPLSKTFENIHTKICKDDNEYYLIDVLRNVCQIELSDDDNYNVCQDCFLAASMAYKFYLQTKQSQEILHFYTDKLSEAINNFDSYKSNEYSSLCIPLPLFIPETPNYNFYADVKVEKNDENTVIIVQNDCDSKNKQDLKLEPKLRKSKKPRRKRGPMTYKNCSLCPIKYRFTSKLQQHMKQDHNIVLYVCKVCKAMTEDEIEHHTHLKTHTNAHECAHCGTVFKRRTTIIEHLKWHENTMLRETVHMCEICGTILPNESDLLEHCDRKHTKKFTCFYCGKMYKCESSFESHIKKHEDKTNNERIEIKQPSVDKCSDAKPRCACDVCGRSFVDERTLMWHQRLHSNERPYVCDICGRGFISLNRRNQHRVCTHSAPTRRCPLCPALFHLRSMVNTHLKKVHLKSHAKRRNRTNKYRDVPWRTETVPIPELSVAIQDDIIQLQSDIRRDKEWNTSQIRR